MPEMGSTTSKTREVVQAYPGIEWLIQGLQTDIHHGIEARTAGQRDAFYRPNDKMRNKSGFASRFCSNIFAKGSILPIITALATLFLSFFLDSGHKATSSHPIDDRSLGRSNTTCIPGRSLHVRSLQRGQKTKRSGQTK